MIRTRSKTTSPTPPVLRGGIPYLGHALEFYRDPVGLLRRGQEQFGEIFSFLLAGSQITVFIGPKANEAFFRASDDQFSAQEAYRFMIPIFGKGIAYDTTPEIMSEQLGFVFPALRETRLNAYAQYMQAEVESYLSAWGASGEVDLLTTMNELTTFIAGRCLIGQEFRQDLSTEFAQLYHDLEGGINLLAFFQPHLPLPSFQRRDRARVRIAELMSNIITKRRRQGTEADDFLQTLMTARYSDGTALSDDNITGLLLTLLFAGQHTSAVLATWTGILLLQHPQYLPPILTEQQSVLSNARSITLEALNQLVVLERAIKEAERLRPPLIMLMRKILGDFEYGGFFVPAGGLAMVAPAVSHRLAEFFQEPDRYNPDRFTSQHYQEHQSAYTMIGFGGGRHRCIGQAFAYQQIKVIWSILLQQYDLELVQHRYDPNYSTFVIGPKQPCLIRYRRKQ
jgi:sterol 14-demethylase